MAKEPSVVIVSPFFELFKRFARSSLEVKLRLLTKAGDPASLPNLDALLNSPLGDPPMAKGIPNSNPLAGYLLESHLKRNGYNARAVFNWADDAALEKALDIDPIALLFSTTFITDRNLLLASIRALRRRIGSLPLIIGGPYIYKQARALVSGFNRERAAALASFGVDDSQDLLFVSSQDPAFFDPIYVASPFGEYTLLDVLEVIRAGSSTSASLGELSNLVLHQSNDTWIQTPTREEPVDLDDDFTHWDMIDDLPPTIPIRTSVGCPYRCKFCDFYLLHEGVHTRSLESITDEIRLATQCGRPFVNFVDDNVFFNNQRATSLSEAIIEKELEIVWGGFFRVDRIGRSNVSSIHRSGCRFGICGIESADTGQLLRMNRKCSIGAMRRGIDLATNEGINVTLTFVVGFPGECRATLDRTAAFLNGLPQQNKGYSPFELYPFYLPPNSLSDDPAFRKRYALHGRCDAWSHQTMAFGEVVSEWAPYLYRQVDTTPYSYSTNDVLFGWSTRKRAEVFGARKEITKAFLESASDRSIQERFSRLHDLMVTSDRLSVAHRWQDVLGGREMQPGRARPALDDSRPTVRGAHGGEP